MSIVKIGRRTYSKQLHKIALLTGPVLFILVIYIAPLAKMLWLSIWSDGFNIDNYSKIVQSPLYLRSLLWTFELAFFTSVLCLVLGYPIAYVMSRCGPRLRFFLLVCIVLPLWTSALVRAFALIDILGREGLINSTLLGLGLIDMPLRLVFNQVAVYIGTVHIMLPYMVLCLYGSMVGLDRTLIRAGETLGGSPMRAFFLIYVPQTMPAITAGFLLVFVISLGFYVTPAVLGGPGVQPFIVLVERSMNQLLDWPLAAALAVVLLVASLTIYGVFGRQLGLAAGRLDLRRSGAVTALTLLATVDRLLAPLRHALRSHSPARNRGRMRRFNLVTPIAIVICVLVALPIIQIVLVSFAATSVIRFPPESFSLRWFEMYFSRTDWVQPTVNSFEIGAIAAFFATLLAVSAALGLRQLSGGARAITLGIFLTPILVPTVVYGLAMYFHLVPFGLTGTKTGLVLAHTMLGMAPGLILVFAAVQGLDERLEDAAASLGAAPWQRLRYVILPLIAPAAGACALVAFLTSFEDLGVALFLTSGTVMTLPRRMYDSILIESDPRVVAASAVVIAISVLVLIGFQLLRHLGRRMTKA